MSENSTKPNPLGLGEQKFVARIFFCKDIFDDSVSYEIGSQFFQALERTFPDNPPLFHQLDSSWSTEEIQEVVGRDKSGKEEDRTKLSIYLKTEWPRRDYKSIWFKDSSIHIRMDPVLEGGGMSIQRGRQIVADMGRSVWERIIRTSPHSVSRSRCPNCRLSIGTVS